MFENVNLTIKPSIISAVITAVRTSYRRKKCSTNPIMKIIPRPSPLYAKYTVKQKRKSYFFSGQRRMHNTRRFFAIFLQCLVSFTLTTGQFYFSVRQRGLGGSMYEQGGGGREGGAMQCGVKGSMSRVGEEG